MTWLYWISVFFFLVALVFGVTAFMPRHQKYKLIGACACFSGASLFFLLIVTIVEFKGW